MPRLIVEDTRNCDNGPWPDPTGMTNGLNFYDFVDYFLRKDCNITFDQALSSGGFRAYFEPYDSIAARQNYHNILGRVVVEWGDYTNNETRVQFRR